MTGLFGSSPVPGELEAGDDAPRPGWSLDGLHQFTQDETDILIRAELVQHGGFSEVMGERDIRVAVLGEPRMIEYPDAYATAQRGRPWSAGSGRQRGGIDTDPHVRRLAFRAWGNRDRARGDIDAIVERYRIKLGLQPWADHAGRAVEELRHAGQYDPRTSYARRSGRTTRGILTTLAKCEAWGINRVMLHDTRYARDHVYRLMLDIARGLGVGVAIGVADEEERRGISEYIAHVDHLELETRRDPADRWLTWSDEPPGYPSSDW